MRIYEKYSSFDKNDTKFPFCIHVKINELQSNFTVGQFKCGSTIFFKISNPVYLILGNCYLVYVTSKDDKTTYTVVYNTTTKTIIDIESFDEIAGSMHKKHDTGAVDVGLFYAPYVPSTILNNVPTIMKINHDS